MKISEVINKLQRIEQEKGDKEFNVYLSYSKVTKTPKEIIFDEGLSDVYVEVYG